MSQNNVDLPAFFREAWDLAVAETGLSLYVADSDAEFAAAKRYVGDGNAKIVRSKRIKGV